MRRDFIYSVLDFLEDQAVDVALFSAAILSAGYGASSGKIDREYRRLSKNRSASIINRERKRQVQKYLWKLKSQGFITLNSSKQISLSRLGRKKIFRHRLVDPESYSHQKSDKVIIISYDVPTPFNRERNILRKLLQAMGFRKIHQSVWVGKGRIPSRFITALSELKVLKFVEILEVTKSGSLKEVDG